MPDETARRRVHVRRADPGDGCDVTRCSRPAAYLVGWAAPGDEPARWFPYCQRHGYAHTTYTAADVDRLTRTGDTDEPF